MGRKPRTRPVAYCGDEQPDGHRRIARSTGEPCASIAGQGTEHLGVGACWMHGGNTKASNEKGKLELAEMGAQDAVQMFGVPVETTAIEALEHELFRAAGHVQWLSIKIATLEQERELKQYQHTDAGGTIERPSVYLDLYSRERKHLLEVTKICLAHNIEQKRIDLLQDQAVLMATAIRGILQELGVLNKPGVNKVVAEHLRLVGGTAVNGG